PSRSPPASSVRVACRRLKLRPFHPPSASPKRERGEASLSFAFARASGWPSLSCRRLYCIDQARQNLARWAVKTDIDEKLRRAGDEVHFDDAGADSVGQFDQAGRRIDHGAGADN